MQLAHLCGAYDMRGRTHTDFSDELVTAVGYATHEVMRAQYQSSHVLIGHDMREKSAEFASLLCHGVAQAGGTPVNIGLASTDQLYFGSGVLNVPGIMVTASHNPADWNGFKVCGPQARGISVRTRWVRLSRLQKPPRSLLTVRCGPLIASGLQNWLNSSHSVFMC